MNGFKAFLARYWKTVGALLGGVTPAIVLTVLGLLGVHLDPATATALAAILAPLIAALGAAIAPKNSYDPPAPTQ